ncbi:UU173 family protein [Mycoplasmopsis agassizii]|uniref:DUF2779 domain-containing protein n=1 Tax=Mycoplasmopsis agassizii TaxID=33922 RepID=A0ABX4H6D2_9BACT|nr:DUF2779 domain-containing protein [Mycoplasmopsis agassizii]PAF55469.1 DUF2779 domain-containing protein [Mycoplasmopsis agassizii]SMC18925.1 protein of unknown function [Mycoplasmopsis agassizii]
MFSEIDEENLITFKEYKRFFSVPNPYFIWHDFNFNKENLGDDLTDENDEEDSDDEGSIFNLNPDEDVFDPQNYHDVITNFNPFEKTNSFAINLLKEDLDDSEIYVVSSKDNKISKLNNTLIALNDEKIKIVFNAYFYWNDFFANVFYFDKRTNEIGVINYKSKSVLDNTLRSIYNLEVIQNALKIDISEHNFLIFDELNSIKKSKNLVYKKTRYANYYKKNYSDGSKLKKEKEGVVDLETLISIEEDFKSGFLHYKNRAKEPIQLLTAKDFYEKLNANAILENEFDNLKTPHLIKNEILYAKNNSFFNINDFNFKEESYDVFYINPFKKDMKNYVFADLISFNGKSYSVKTNDHELVIKNLLNEHSLIQEKEVIPNNYKTDFLNLMYSYLKKDQVLVWFDFESINLPETAFKGYTPYSQVPFQVSIVRTINGEYLKGEWDSEDIVFDPENLDIELFANMVRRISSFKDFASKDKDYKYITYNKSFENGVLKKLKSVFKYHNHPDYEDLAKRIDYITFTNKDDKSNDNLLDLADFFFYRSNKEDSAKKNYSINNTAIVFLGYLKGKYSIKLLEKFISSKHSDKSFSKLITPYKELEIKNGLLAMTEGVKKYLGLTHQQIWDQQLVPNLKKYCHNDVMSMVMVLEYLIYLLKRDWKDLKNLQTNFDKTNVYVDLD